MIGGTLNDKNILTVNAGSSSIKLVLFEATTPPKRILEATIEKIGWPEPRLVVKRLGNSESISRPAQAADHTAAATILMNLIKQEIQPDKLLAIGHRVVHGGPKYSQSQLVTQDVLDELKKLADFDPEHLPIELQLIEAFGRSFAGAAQVACFDTAFHHDLPTVARLLPIPLHYEKQGVRRYGFHGLSYTFLMQALAHQAGADIADGRVILAHLGNGASLAAVHGGKSIDTSMGFTPSSGIPMSTRTGDLDPGLALYLVQSQGIDEFNKMVNFQSGLLGMSETSSDMEKLLQIEDSDSRAADAIALFCYQVKKCIGSYAAALGGLDTLVFAGGIGENAPKVRARICEDLDFLGITIDKSRNEGNEALISSDNSLVAVRVIHTDEAMTIAREAQQILGGAYGNEPTR